jgi:hypothetical protein
MGQAGPLGAAGPVPETVPVSVTALELTPTPVFMVDTEPPSGGQDYSLCVPFDVVVRTGLVAIGVALAVVGAGLSLSAFFEPGAPPLSGVNPVAAPNLQPGQPRTMIVWLHNTSSGSLGLTWVASSDVNVSLYLATNCLFVGAGTRALYCPEGPPLATWASNSSGHWNTSGTIRFPFLLNLQNPGPKTVNLTAVFDEVWASSSPKVPTWIFVSVLAGGVTCLTLGAIAIFLGLFLRSGVYSDPAPEDPVDGDASALLEESDELELEDDELGGEPPD